MPTLAEKHLIQELIRHPVLTESEAQRVYTMNGGDLQLQEAIKNINVALHDLAFQVTRYRSQHGNMPWVYIYHNTRSDETMKLATWLSVDEIEYLKLLLERILDPEYDYTVGSVEAINIQLPSLSVKRKELLVEKLLDHNWLYKNAHGKVSLGDRGTVELAPLLADKYDVPKCLKCQQLCVSGFRCNCGDTTVHRTCHVTLQGPMCCSQPDDMTKIGA